MKITITTKGLTKMYDGSHGIRNVDLDIKSGTCFGFLGQNGAGKTTTIKILIGLIRPQSGTAVVDGYDVLAEPDKVRKVIGYLPDTYGLYDYMTGYEIVDYTARLHGFGRQDRQEIVADLLKKLDLYEARDKKAGQYSKGMRQKLALARALVNDPDVLFLDEPTSGLDPQAARNIEDLINRLKKDGKTLFITSHILPEVEKVCDRLAIIKEGTVRVHGDMDEMKRRHFTPSLRLRVTGEPAAALNVIRALGKAEVSDGSIRIYGDRHGDLDAMAPAVSGALAKAGIGILEMARDEHSLEDVYFKVMGE
ncbi:MAG: Trehalose/maltose import ATP-binding protein MalK [Methanocella sp. PtaU1.Bin125]|nr:MAG: Trehalose/maltose import ATP-binding protein MalK [Methanocella sp. PtaU1.Bin125]